MHRRAKFAPRISLMSLSVLVSLMIAGLIGCSPADVRDIKNAASDSATLAAIMIETQPAKSAQSTKKPTRTATQNATPAPKASKRVDNSSRVKNTPGDFDFYVLVLSWSPDYCAGSDVNDPQQCGIGKKLGFVLHGLWPQYTRGYPSDCSTTPLPNDAQERFPNLFPNSKLYTHEWDKHGTCSGLTPAEYLTLAKTLKDSIAIPTGYRGPAKALRTTTDQLKAEFVAANPAVNADALAVQCSGSGRYLKELYVCFSREGQPLACSQEIQNDATRSCGRVDFLIRNMQ
jgi:ribonuclease T2